ncbi:hypothetical protein TNCV_2872021 [Trichonephila clavipes]|nr:hypothetical protein TNCV_2872021 [Trichonephila clavipes]
MFENADKCIKTYKTEEQHVEVVYKTVEYHLDMLAKNFKKYSFAEDNLIASYEWAARHWDSTLVSAQGSNIRQLASPRLEVTSGQQLSMGSAPVRRRASATWLTTPGGILL